MPKAGTRWHPLLYIKTPPCGIEFEARCFSPPPKPAIKPFSNESRWNSPIQPMALCSRHDPLGLCALGAAVKLLETGKPRKQDFNTTTPAEG